MGIYGNLQYSWLTQFRSLNFPEHKQRAKCHRERERERKRLVIPRAKVGQREKFRESVWCDTNLPWIKFRGYYNCSCCWHVPKFRFSPFSSFAPFAFAFAVIALLVAKTLNAKNTSRETPLWYHHNRDGDEKKRKEERRDAAGTDRLGTIGLHEGSLRDMNSATCADESVRYIRPESSSSPLSSGVNPIDILVLVPLCEIFGDLGSMEHALSDREWWIRAWLR